MATALRGSLCWSRAHWHWLVALLAIPSCSQARLVRAITTPVMGPIRPRIITTTPAWALTTRTVRASAMAVCMVRHSPWALAARAAGAAPATTVAGLGTTAAPGITGGGGITDTIVTVIPSLRDHRPALGCAGTIRAFHLPKSYVAQPRPSRCRNDRGRVSPAGECSNQRRSRRAISNGCRSRQASRSARPTRLRSLPHSPSGRSGWRHHVLSHGLPRRPRHPCVWPRRPPAAATRHRSRFLEITGRVARFPIKTGSTRSAPRRPPSFGGSARASRPALTHQSWWRAIVSAGCGSGA